MHHKPNKKKSKKNKTNIKIKKGTWVHPIRGNSARPDNVKRSRYLCVTNPYRDPEKLKKQKEYWKSKYNIDIEKEWLVDVIITSRKRELDSDDEKVVVLRNNKQYIFPLEMLRPNKEQKNYKIIIDDLNTKQN